MDTGHYFLSKTASMITSLRCMLRVKFRVEKGDQYGDWDLFRLYFWPLLNERIAWRKEYIFRSDPIPVKEFEFECVFPSVALRDGEIGVEVKKGGFAGFFRRKRRV